MAYCTARIPGSHSMIERILFVDYENIQAVDLSSLPADVKVRFVLGGKQAKLPSELAIHAHAMGDRFAYVRILSVQTNACDSAPPSHCQSPVPSPAERSHPVL